MLRDWDADFRRRLFEDIDREFSRAEEMLNRTFRTLREINPTDLAETFPYYFGYQITIGPDGKPHVREFGNIKPAARGLVKQRGFREPLVDTVMNEKENTLIMTAELPGVTKEDIKVKISDDYITIHAENREKKYHTDIPVDIPLDKKTAKATYVNGILELKVKPRQFQEPDGTEIKVE